MDARVLGVQPTVFGPRHRPRHIRWPGIARSIRAACTGDRVGELGWQHFENPEQAELQLGTLVGAGSYGIVREADLKGSKVAVKVIKKKRGSQARSKVLRKLAREIELLTRLQDCCNVVQLLTVYEDDKHAYLVCELCRGGDLERVLTDRGPFSERAAAKVVYEALKMVAACHSNNVIHGDVKPANFLLRQVHSDPIAFLEAGNQKGAWLKSVDFGCSQVVLADHYLTRRTGTPVYMAPEIFLRRYGLEADLWSVGIMFYQLVASRFPFWSSIEECRSKNVDEVMHTVLNSNIPLDYGPWLRMSSEGLDLMRQLTQRSPELRISAAQALQHAWFKSQLHSAPPAQPQRSNIIPRAPKAKKVAQPVQEHQPRQQRELRPDSEPSGSSMGSWMVPELYPSLVPL